MNTGSLIVNADDWGRDQHTTEKIFECFVRGTVSSVSAMMFMTDSERAAALAREHGVDAGLHLNFTTSFSGENCPPALFEAQNKVASLLSKNALARGIYHPKLASTFEYLVRIQCDEFCRIYGVEPPRFDGHHHMHLCANVLFGRLLPDSAIVRPHFSYEPGEKVFRNSVFRKFATTMLSRYRVVDFLFSLPPLQPERLKRIAMLASNHVVEVETHPTNPAEFAFLTGDEISQLTGNTRISSHSGNTPELQHT